VLLVGAWRRVLPQAYGSRALEPRREAMTADNDFLICIADQGGWQTTTCVMQLFRKGKIRLNDPVAKYCGICAERQKTLPCGSTGALLRADRGIWD